MPRITNLAWCGIFAVSRKDIHIHPRAYYEELLPYLETSSNPECGHYFERAWGAIFHRESDDEAQGIEQATTNHSTSASACVSISVILMLFSVGSRVF